MRFLIAALVLASSTASAQNFGSLVMGDAGEDKGPVFAFTEKGAFVAPKTIGDAAGPLGIQEWMTERDVDAVATDKKSTWVSADLVDFEIGCGAAPCPPEPPPGPAQWHATALYDGKQILVWHIARVVKGKEQAAALKKGTTPPKLDKKIGAGAEEVVKVFEGSIGDPKTLAATVSDRKDVVLYGNEPKERTVGGAKVKAKLTAWKLGFTVRDGIQAG